LRLSLIILLVLSHLSPLKMPPWRAGVAVVGLLVVALLYFKQGRDQSAETAGGSLVVVPPLLDVSSSDPVVLGSNSNITSTSTSYGTIASGGKRLPSSTGFYGNKNPSKAILVESYFFSDPPGGVEAMIQLTIALCQAVKDCANEVFITKDKYHPRYLPIYGDKLLHRTKNVKDLQPGDIYVINEGIECQTVPDGVHQFVWLLASYRGCKDTSARFISHNQHLTTFEGLRLPRERVIHPYLSPPMVEAAFTRAGLTQEGVILYDRSQIRGRKEDLVLVDNDVPHAVEPIIREAAVAAGGRALTLDNLNRSQMIDAYERGKVMFDWCMRGSERCPLEAALFGAVSVSNACDTGLSFADFPVPADFLLPWTDLDKPPEDKKLRDGAVLVSREKLKERLTAVFRRAFDRYWELQPAYEPLRRSILDHNLPSMTREAARFLSTVYIADAEQMRSISNSNSKNRSKGAVKPFAGTTAARDSTALMPGGCKQC